MLHLHLYIKSLLQEVKLENEKLNKIFKKIEDSSLYIEQLNQEIVETIKKLLTKGD